MSSAAPPVPAQPNRYAGLTKNQLDEYLLRDGGGNIANIEDPEGYQEAMRAASIPYYGKTRAQLTIVLERARARGKEPLHPEAFKAAWDAAPPEPQPAAAPAGSPSAPQPAPSAPSVPAAGPQPIKNKVTRKPSPADAAAQPAPAGSPSAPQPIPASDREAWQHPDYSDTKIASMSHEQACAALDKLQRLPKGFDVMGVEALREVLTQAAQDDKVHLRYAAIQRDKATEKEHARLDTFTRTTGKNTIVLEHGPIANHLHEQFNTVSFNKTLFVYDTEKGIYRENAGDLEQAIRLIIEETSAKCSITRDTRDILHYLLATGPQLEYPFNQVNDLLPLKKGILKLNFETGKADLLPPGPEHLFTYQIPVEYDPKMPAKEARDLIGQWVQPEDIPLLIQMAAQAVLQAQLRVSYKKSYILQGEPHAGKSAFIEFLTRFFGTAQVSSRSLQSLCTDRFVAADLEGKLLNAYDDLQEIPLENVGSFKALTGACNHNIERKFQQSYFGVITCPHIFSCNHPPKYPDDVKYDAAFWERWEYVSFPYSHAVDDTFMSRTFTDRMYSSFLNLVIESMMIIRKNKRLTVNREACDVMERWSMAADPLYQFIREKMVENARASEINMFDRKKLFEQYRKFCEQEQIDPRKRIPSLSKFTRDIQGYKMTPTRTSKKVDGRKHAIDVYQGPYSWNAGEGGKDLSYEIDPEVSNVLDV